MMFKRREKERKKERKKEAISAPNRCQLREKPQEGWYPSWI